MIRDAILTHLMRALIWINEAPHHLGCQVTYGFKGAKCDCGRAELLGLGRIQPIDQEYEKEKEGEL